MELEGHADFTVASLHLLSIETKLLVDHPASALPSGSRVSQRLVPVFFAALELLALGLGEAFTEEGAHSPGRPNPFRLDVLLGAGRLVSLVKTARDTIEASVADALLALFNPGLSLLPTLGGGGKAGPIVLSPSGSNSVPVPEDPAAGHLPEGIPDAECVRHLRRPLVVAYLRVLGSWLSQDTLEDTDLYPVQDVSNRAASAGAGSDAADPADGGYSFAEIMTGSDLARPLAVRAAVLFPLLLRLSDLQQQQQQQQQQQGDSATSDRGSASHAGLVIGLDRLSLSEGSHLPTSLFDLFFPTFSSLAATGDPDLLTILLQGGLPRLAFRSLAAGYPEDLDVAGRQAPPNARLTLAGVAALVAASPASGAEAQPLQMALARGAKRLGCAQRALEVLLPLLVSTESLVQEFAAAEKTGHRSAGQPASLFDATGLTPTDVDQLLANAEAAVLLARNRGLALVSGGVSQPGGGVSDKPVSARQVSALRAALGQNPGLGTNLAPLSAVLGVELLLAAVALFALKLRLQVDRILTVDADTQASGGSGPLPALRVALPPAV
ncbi:hypothetical protein H696_02439 [Fonticula alba]|uniref:Uncharacterized protein n=1 Tax=Fonticula alba TaxID=691883 RepID=A0A058ZAQ1_FONAL|nr:hypothetical protein H696_02439 [Fonticula alba]KCV71495.1 hypothetical protein H696_02439 [Fonticula alba]|eukprot:XP_009494618.1 hypothetical protein H696_02439 [Fonticula alba]